MGAVMTSFGAKVAARIHIIDDDPGAFAAMARLLRERGHTVNTGEHDPVPPDLVLCAARHADAVLAEGRHAPPHVPLVVLVERADGGRRDALLAAGAGGYIALPFEPASFADEVEAFLPPAAPAPAPAAAVLLVDDDAFMLEVLADLVEQQGWRVLAASSGEQALAILARTPVALVVSDHVMPGMRGAELLARARRLYPDTVRILLSGQEEEAEIAEALRSGAADRFYAKPWRGDALMAALREAVALQRTRARV